MELIVPAVLTVLALLLAGPIIGLVALSRLRGLEWRLAQLERRADATVRVSEAPADQGTAVETQAPPPISVVAQTEPPSPPAELAASAATADDAFASAQSETFAATPESDLETIIGGRWLNRVGLLAVAVGVSYFLKYAIDNDWIGPHGQVALGLLLGAGFVVWSQQFSRRGWHYFADGIAGLGASVLYLSLWAGSSYYGFIPTNAGLAAMIAVTAAMAVIALGRNRAPLAALTLIGGFLTPWLVGIGDAQVKLFSYLALHNAALVALAYKRDWRFLELPAFALTQVYFWQWYDRFYSDDVLMRTAVYAVLFFLQFSALPAVRAQRTGSTRPEHALLALVNTAALLVALTAMLWPQHRWMLALSALSLSAFHLGLARLLPARVPAESPARLVPAGLAITLSAVAIAIRLDEHWVTLAWAIEAGVLAWTGFSAGLRFPRIASYVMFTAVGTRLLAVPLHSTEFLFNARLGTVLVVAACAALATLSARRHRELLGTEERYVVALLGVAANVLVLWALTLEVGLYFQISAGPGTRDILLARSLTISVLWTLYATGLLASGVRLQAAAVRWQGLALFGVATAKVFLFDLGYLSGIYRIASSVALGVVLLIVSFFYQRSLATRRTAQENQP